MSIPMISVARRLFLALSLSVMGILYAEMILIQRPPGWGGDFDIFYAAASVLAHHGNPYDLTQLLGRELAIFHPDARWYAVLAGEPYPQSPLLLLVLQPLLLVTPSMAYFITAIAIGLAVVGTLIVLQQLYPIRTPIPLICILAVSPPCFLGLHGGQIDALLVCAAVAALLAMEKHHYAIAGALIAISLVKPNIMLAPLLLLCGLAIQRGGFRRYIYGLLGGFIATAGAWSLVGGPGLTGQWLEGMHAFTAYIAGVLPSDPSLLTLYGGWAPHAFPYVAILAPAVWLIGMALLWRRCTTPDAQTWWIMLGLVSWIIVTPHAHEYDEILALPAVWWAYRRLPETGLSRTVGAAFWMAWSVCPLTFLFRIDYHALPVQGTGALPFLILTATLIWLAPRRTAVSIGTVDAQPHLTQIQASLRG